MKSVCEALDVAALSRNLARQLGRRSVSADMREFASYFVALQHARHLADYDPGADFSPSSVERLVDAAKSLLPLSIAPTRRSRLTRWRFC